MPRRRTLHAFLPPAVTALLLLSTGPLVAQQYDEGVVELSIRQLPERPTVAILVDAAGRFLLPLQPVLAYAGIPSTASDTAVVLDWPPGEWRTVLRFADRTVRVGSQVETISTDEWVRRPDGLYLSAEALARVLRSEVSVDLANVIVRLENERFPAVRQLALEAERAAGRGRFSRLDPRFRAPDAPYPGRTGGVALDWDLSLAQTGDASQQRARGAAGVSVLGGALEAGASLVAGTGIDAGLADPFARYTRVFPMGRGIQQIQLGSFLSEGPLGIHLTGAAAGNDPYVPPELFDETVIRPALPAGWEYEVYQGDYLVGVSRGDAAEGVRAPIGYGTTPVRVRLLGPSGQERTEEVVFLVPPSRVAAGAWRWAAGGGACVDSRCDAYGYANLRRGLTRWLTLGLGGDRLARADSLGDQTGAYGILSLSPIPSISAELQGRPGAYARGSVHYFGSQNANARAAFAWYGRGVADFAFPGWRADASASAPLPNLLGGRWIGLRAFLRGDEDGALESWQGSVGLPFRRGYLSVDYESGLQPRDVFSLRASLAPGPGSRFGRRDASYTLAVGATEFGAELAELGVSLRPSRRGTVTAFVQWRRESKQPSLQLGYAARLRGAYAEARAATRDDEASVYLNASGGVSLGAGAGTLANTYHSVGAAGLTGRVYVDADGDGRFGPGDEPLDSASVLYEGQRVVTDARGVFRAWNLQPYRTVRLSVDSLLLPDPALAPARADTAVRPSPNMFTEVDLRVIRTREVTGTVVGGAGVATVGGLAVEFVDARGEMAAVVRTFTDGEFYLSRLRPGSYTVRVAESSLRALGARMASPPLPLAVPPTGDAPVEVPQIRLVR